jgi:hypothetical protein
LAAGLLLVAEPLLAVEALLAAELLLGVVIVGGAAVLDRAGGSLELVGTAAEVVNMVGLLSPTLLVVTRAVQGLPKFPLARDVMRARREVISKEAYIDVYLYNR